MKKTKSPAVVAPTVKPTTKPNGTTNPPKTNKEKEIPTTGPNGEMIYPPKVPTPWILSYKIDRKIEDFPENKLILESYPGSYVAKFPNMGKLSHPLIRYERIFLEQEAMRNLFRCGVSKVLDVGGSVQRASAVVAAINKVEQVRANSLIPVYSYYSCNPTLAASDVVRNQKHKDYLRHHTDLSNRVEWTTLEKSNHVNACDALLFNHSLYYFSEEGVFDAMVKTTEMRGLAITHVFKQGAGSFPGATYFNENGNVTMHVEGNSFPYTHSDIAWLTNSNAYTKEYNGKAHTMCWSVIQQGLHTALYQFTVIEATVKPDYVGTPVKQEIIAEDVLSSLTLSFKEPGPCGVFVFEKKNRTRFTVIPAIVKFAKDTCFMGKKPDEAAFRQAVGKMRSVEAEKLISSEVRNATWYSQAFTQSLVVAFLECAFEYNAAQAWVADLMPMLEQMAFGKCVTRELAVTEKVTNAMLKVSNGIKTVGEACGMDVTKDDYIVDTADVSFGTSTAAKTAQVLVNATSPATVKVSVPVVPFGIAADPERVQREVDVRVAQSKTDEKLAKVARKLHPVGSPDHQDILSVTSIKRFMSCKIRENVVKRSATPWVFTAKLGPPLLPNTTSTASIASAKIHRLFDGKEHLNNSQNVNLKKTWTEMKNSGYLPTNAIIAARKEVLPLMSSRDWLSKQYGRRHDPKAVANLLEGIKERETTGKVHHDYQFFVKKEAALAKGNTNKFRGIFVADPTYASLVNPFYYNTMKILCKCYHPSSAHGLHTVISAGLTAPDVGAAIGAAIERIGSGGIIIEMDASSYEANQTQEHNHVVVDFYKDFNPPPEIIKAIENMYDVRVLEKVDAEGNRKLSFFREGGMGSGIGDVSLRNSLNTIMARWSLLRAIGYSVEEILTLTFAMILGDDNWVLVPGDDRTCTITQAFVADHFLINHGWIMKCNIYPLEEYTKSEFCSMYPFQYKSGTTTEWGMSLKPGRFFAKTMVTKVQVERGMDTMQQLKGMVCGAGHFTNGWLMSKCLRVLYDKLSHISLDGINFDHDFDFQPTYKYNNCPIADPGEDAIKEDEMRYGLSAVDLKTALSHFKSCASNFPKGPLIISKQVSWDAIIAIDMPTNEDDFSDDLRLDSSMPDIKEVRKLPKSWYNKTATGHYNIYPTMADGGDKCDSSFLGLGVFLG